MLKLMTVEDYMSTAKQRSKIRKETKLLVENLTAEEIYTVLEALGTPILRQALQTALHRILLDCEKSSADGEN